MISELVTRKFVIHPTNKTFFIKKKKLKTHSTEKLSNLKSVKLSVMSGNMILVIIN